MKKYFNPSPVPNGGMPIFAGDFIDCLQTEVYRAILANYKIYNQPVVVYGCQVVANQVAGNCTIAAGMAYIDGDLIDVPNYAGTYPVYLVQDTPVNIAKNYKDEQPRTVMVQKACTWSNALPNGAEYILFDPFTSQYLADVQRRYITPSKRCEWFPDYPDANAFDVTGKGRWSWLGFNVANGENATVNLTGRIPAQFDPFDLDFAIGNPFGEKKHQLTTPELPKTQVKIGVWASNDNGTGAIDAGQGNAGDLLSNFFGNDQAHNNVQPTLSGVWLQRA